LERKAMHTATRKGPHHVAAGSPPPALPDPEALLSELGVVYPVMTFAGAEDDAPPTDAGEAPSGSSNEERRSGMDERIMAGLLRA
jgi:hypothetical protein